MVNIKGINKLKLLKALWERSFPDHSYEMCGCVPPKWDKKVAKEALFNGYIDHLLGRPIWMDLSKDVIDPTRYDQRCCVKGACKKIVELIYV